MVRPALVSVGWLSLILCSFEYSREGEREKEGESERDKRDMQHLPCNREQGLPYNCLANDPLLSGHRCCLVAISTAVGPPITRPEPPFKPTPRRRPCVHEAGPRRYGEACPVGGRDRPPPQPPGADASHVRRRLRHGGGGSDAPGGVETGGAKEFRQPGEVRNTSVCCAACTPVFLVLSYNVPALVAKMNGTQSNSVLDRYSRVILPRGAACCNLIKTCSPVALNRARLIQAVLCMLVHKLPETNMVRPFPSMNLWLRGASSISTISCTPGFRCCRTALRFAESSGHDEVACILRVDPSVSTIQESAAAGRVHEVWALMRQVRTKEMDFSVRERLYAYTHKLPIVR